MRALGFALDEASLQQIAYANGIEQTYSTMTQAEKAQLRYIALMTQIPQVQGDMARTITSSANALRVLQQQFTLLGREIGNIFIPLLNAIIPIAIAVVKVLGKVAKAIAQLFGFTIPDLNWDGVQQTTGGIATDLEDANGSATKLKRQLAGFDELNNLTTPSSGGSGTGTSPVGGGLDVPLPEYDMLEGLDKGIEDLTQQVMDFFGLTEDASGKLSWSFSDMDNKAKALMVTLGVLAGVKVLGKLANVVGTVGKAFTFLFGAKGVQGSIGLFGKLGNAIKGVTSLGLVQYFKNSASAISAFVKGTASGKTALTAILSPAKKVLTVLGKFAGVAGGIISIIDGIGRMGDAFDGVTNQTMSLDKAMGQSLLSFGEFVAGGTAIGAVFGGPVGAAIGAVAGAVGGLTVAWINYNNAIEQIASDKLYGSLTLTSQELDTINQKLIGTLQSQNDAYQNFKKTIQSSAEEFKSTADGLDILIYKYQVLGEDLTGTTASDILNSISDTTKQAKSLIDSGTNELTNLLASQFSSYTTLTEEEQRNIINVVQTNGKTRKEKIQTLEDEIYDIYERAIAERGYLNDSEIQAIREHYQQIVDLTSNEMEMAGLELNRILSNVQDGTIALSKEGSDKLNEQLKTSTDEGLELIKNNYNARLETAKTTAQQAYENAIASGDSQVEAQKKYNETYNTLANDAESARQKSQQELYSKLSEIRNTFYNNALKEYAIYSQKQDSELSDSEKKYKEMLNEVLLEAGYTQQDLARIALDAAKNGTDNFNNNWNPIAKFPTPSTDMSPFSNAGLNAGSAWSSGFAKNASINSVLRQNGGSATINWQRTSLSSLIGFAEGGFPDTGQFFMARENGIPEMVGRIGNRTAVANNDQIVEAVENGVYRAVVNANSGGSGTNYFNVNIGNRKVYNGIAQNVRNENNRYGKSVIEV
ncbi:MAG TPA: hypothetical protein IAB40_06350 [Candidatus Onthocola stercoravium]|nr:hypothetical protein [Candidatus Onthocola stercoravium]